MPKVFTDRTARVLAEMARREMARMDGGAGNPIDVPRPAARTFRNDSSETIPAYGCMRVTGAEEDPNTDRKIVVVDKPNSTGGPFLFNGPREVETNKYGQYQDGPVVDAYYTSGTVAAKLTWGPLSDWVIVNNGNPAIQLYGEVETDIVRGNSVLGQVTKIGKADAAVTFDSTGTVSVWRTNGSGTLVDTTENITGVELDWMHGDENISLGKEVMIQWFPDEALWRFTGSECE